MTLVWGHLGRLSRGGDTWAGSLGGVTLAYGCDLTHVKVLGFRHWMSFSNDVNCSIVEKVFPGGKMFVMGLKTCCAFRLGAL